jgi:two-component system cell cycle sensor histidine kinase/response regulator CckA
MEQSAQLANFAEWNPNPILELSGDGTVIYANLIARTQFPDILTLGLAHPILKGLGSVIRDFQPNQQSEVIVYNREIEVNKKCYEQQIFGFLNSCIYVYMIEVTERKQLKAQAHFNDKLSTIGMLAAGVAHEINNPITWVLGNLSLLQNFTNTLSTDLLDDDEHSHATEVPELLAKIDETIIELMHGMEQVRDITRSLKGLSRIDKNETLPADVHKILNMAIRMASLEFKNRAHLEKNFAENMPLILSNPGKLHQVFLNLLINAAQAIPANDAKQNTIRVSTHIENGSIRVDISDTGKGIAPDILPKIFEPFFTTKQGGQGTGLGLSICREIVRDLKAEMSVKSTVGEGTRFTVYLRIPREALKKTATLDVVTPSKNNKQILLIDDEPMLLKLMQRILQSHGHITTALGGNNAMQLIAERGKEFDIIITDLNMPEVSGSDLYRHAAEKHPGLEKRFVFITGGVEMPWVKEFLTTTGNPVLEKPFLPKDMIDVVDKIYESLDSAIK